MESAEEMEIGPFQVFRAFHGIPRFNSLRVAAYANKIKTDEPLEVKNALEEINSGCPVCQGSDLCHPFPGLLQFQECGSCGLLFQERADTDATLNRIYEDEEADTSAQRISEEEIRRGAYYDRVVRRIFGQRAEPGRVLEIGCGAGGLLLRLRKAGWECEGVEPSKRLRTQAQATLCGQVPIHGSRMENLENNLRNRPYDAVVGMDVLEHLPDPWSLPRKACDWLSPGGTLFLQTPNAKSFRRYLQRETWEQLAPEEHLFLHTRRSLSRLLETSGFGDIRIQSLSGSTTDSRFRGWMMKPIGGVLGWVGMGNGLWAVARKGER